MISKEEAYANAPREEKEKEERERRAREIEQSRLHSLPEFALNKVDEAVAALRQQDAGTAGMKLGELRQAIIENAKELGYG